MCPSCGFAAPEGAKFCAGCGERLGAACPSCGAQVPAGARFCPECGSGLPATAGSAGGASVAATRAPSVPTTERRLVSILFADLVGFTSFAEDRDAEQVRDTLSRYFEIASEVVGRYGGTIEKFIGDAVMAVWGTPLAHEDDAERAVRAGLELVDAVTVIASGVQARAGVMTGEAAATLGAVNQGMVAGDLVNTAARLQSVAVPGAVLVGTATRDATVDSVRYEPAGERSLKGKEAPVAAWRALRVIGDSRGPTFDAFEAPFAGRAEELRLLKETFHATGRERRARLVSLVGQAGIGKSRIAWELEKYIDGIVEVVRWHRGRSPAYGEGVTFWALGEMVRRRAGLAEGDDELTTRGAITAMVEAHVPDPAERRWIEPRMLALLGLDEAPPGGRDELFAAWRTFFERLANEATVALVFEDVHWADDGLLDFIEHLLVWSRDQPIFVVTLARPELLERRPGWGTDRRGAMSLRLEPLPDAAIREFLEALVPGLPADVVDQVLARAAGIPLYAVETVRMLVADGRLARADNGTFRPTRELGDLAIPTTLHALVAARLDALPQEARTLLQVAAVLGQTFSEGALAEVMGQPTERLAGSITLLHRRELLTIETDPRSPARGQESFVQSMVREVAYSTLAKRERRTWHMAAARYFENLGDEELAGVLATHHVAAWRAAPDGPEGDAAAAQARVSLHAAADRAEALGARRQAVDWLKTSLEVTPDPADRAALLQRLATTAWGGGFIEEAKASSVEAESAWSALGRPVERLRAVGTLVMATLTGGDITSARRAVADNLDAARALEGNPDAEATLAHFWEAAGRAAFRAGDAAESIDYCDAAIPPAERLGLDDTHAMALITKATALTSITGRFREGIALLSGAVADATRRGQYPAAVRGLANLAAMTVLDDPRGSLATSREALDIARRLGLAGFLPYICGNLGPALRTGDWDWARETWAEARGIVTDPMARQWISDFSAMFEVARGVDVGTGPEDRLARAERTGDPQELVNGLWWAIERDLHAGEFGRAVAWARRVRDEADNSNESWPAVGRAAILAADLELAEFAHREMTKRRGAGALEVDALMVRAGIAAHEGRTAEAVDRYRAVLASYGELGLPYDVAWTGYMMAVVLPADESVVVAAVDESRRILVGLGAMPLLARLDEVATVRTTASVDAVTVQG